MSPKQPRKPKDPQLPTGSVAEFKKLLLAYYLSCASLSRSMISQTSSSGAASSNNGKDPTAKRRRCEDATEEFQLKSFKKLKADFLSSVSCSDSNRITTNGHASLSLSVKSELSSAKTVLNDSPATEPVNPVCLRPSYSSSGDSSEPFLPPNILTMPQSELDNLIHKAFDALFAQAAIALNLPATFPSPGYAGELQQSQPMSSFDSMSSRKLNAGASTTTLLPQQLIPSPVLPENSAIGAIPLAPAEPD